MLAGGDTEPSPLNYTGVTRSLDKGKTWTPLQSFDCRLPPGIQNHWPGSDRTQ